MKLRSNPPLYNQYRGKKETKYTMEGIDTTKFLERFKVHTPKTLFEPTAWDLTYWLTKRKCPLCFKKLYVDTKGNGRCKSKKSNDKFFIKADSLKKYI